MENHNVMELFESKDIVRICAPMVRYSKQPFRQLVRKYGCDIAYTPMIIADSFLKSSESRDVEFTTCATDRPVVLQFAVNNAKDLADVTELVQPHCDGIGINCGCPQRWAMAEGYGCSLLKKPELLKDMIQQTRQRVDQSFPLEIKIRLKKDIRETVEMCQQAQHCGVSWISVHGRTVYQRKQPVDYEAIKTIKESLQIPVVANGDIRNIGDVISVKERTNVDGVMAAQGLLSNPAMYAGYSVTPKSCVEDWLNIGISVGVPFVTFHQHFIFMLDKWHAKGDRYLFNNLSSTVGVVEFLKEHHGIEFSGIT